MTLEEALLAAANKGLTHLSLHPVFSEDRKTTYWRATATPSTMHKYVSTQGLNPVEAVLEVLKALPKAPTRHAPNPNPNLRGSGDLVTAAVKPQPVDLDENVGSNDPHRPSTTLDQIDPPAEGLDTWLPKA